MRIVTINRKRPSDGTKNSPSCDFTMPFNHESALTLSHVENGSVPPRRIKQDLGALFGNAVFSKIQNSQVGRSLDNVCEELARQVGQLVAFGVDLQHAVDVVGRCGQDGFGEK